MMVSTAVASPLPASPPQTEGGEGPVGTGEGRTDFGALLAGFVAPLTGAGTALGGGHPPAAPVERSQGGSDTTTPGDTAALSVEGARTSSPPLPAPFVSPTTSVIAPPAADVAIGLSRSGVLADPAAPVVADEMSTSDTGEVTPDARTEQPKGTAPLPAEMVAAEIVRHLMVRASGAVPSDGAVADPASTDTPVASPPALAADRRPSAPAARVTDTGVVSEALSVPLAHLRDLVRGSGSHATRTDGTGAVPTSARGGDEGTVANASTPGRPRTDALAVVNGGISDGPHATAPSRASGEPREAIGVAGAAPEEVPTRAAPVTVAEAMPTREDTAEPGVEMLLTSPDDAPSPSATVLPGTNAGTRDAAPTGPRTAPAAPPPTVEPPPTPPVSTSHATLDLALADGTTGRLRVAVRGDVVHATILAEGAAAVMLERELPGLRRALAERGFPEAQLAVRLPGGDAPVAPLPAPVAASPDRAAAGRDRDEGTPRHPHPDRQDPTEDQRSRERRRPPQPEEYP